MASARAIAAVGLVALLVRFLGPSDRVVLEAKSPRTALLVQGRYSHGCKRGDQSVLVESPGTVLRIGNLIPDAGCPSVIGIFAVDRRVQLLRYPWSVNADETPAVPALALKDVSVAVFVQPPENPDDDTGERIDADLCRLQHVLNTMRCGARIQPTVYWLTSLPPTVNCSDFDGLRKIAEPDRVNIFYVFATNGAKGCHDPMTKNIAVVSQSADNETAAHEVGHVFGLGEYGGDNDENVMKQQSSVRTTLTLGQCFRCNTGKGSLLLDPKEVPLCDETIAASCPSDDWPNQDPARPPAASPSLEQVIRRYYECEHCTSETGAINKLAEDPALHGTLAQALMRSTRPHGDVQDHLRRTYRQLVAYGRTHDEMPMKLSEQEYFRLYEQAALIRYRFRAGLVLVRMLDAPDARNALNEIIRLLPSSIGSVLQALIPR